MIIGGMVKRINFLFKDMVEAVDTEEDIVINEDKDDVSLTVRPDKDEEESEDIADEVEKKDNPDLSQEGLDDEDVPADDEIEDKLGNLDIEKEPNKKLAYLTFDDGPSKRSTPAILDILDEYNIKATFFVIGEMAQEHPEILKDIYEAGHQIGNHTYSHNMKCIYQSVDNFMNDIYRAERAIKDILGEEFDSRIIRFPGGSFETRKKPMRKATVKAGYQYFDWNALNGDAEGKYKDKRQLLNRLKETTKDKENIVVLMHDTDAKQSTVEFLRDGIEYLISQGYEFAVLKKNN